MLVGSQTWLINFFFIIPRGTVLGCAFGSVVAGWKNHPVFMRSGNPVTPQLYIYIYICSQPQTSRRGENRASGCSFFAILCGWRCGPVAILWSDNCSKIPGIFKVHFNDVLVFTGENVFRARRFLSFISSAVFCSRRGLWQTSSHFCHCFAIATGKLLLLAADLGWLSHWCVCSNCYGYERVQSVATRKSDM